MDLVKSLFKQHKTTWLFILDILLNLAIIAAMVFLIRTFLISPFQVFGPSMCDTLNNIDNTCQRGYGEYIIVDKFGYQNFLGLQVGLPQRGDIVVFHPPLDKTEFFIKRVIGLPGETVELRDGYVYIHNQLHPEGIKLDEPYLNATNSGKTNPFTANMSMFEVPANSYFVMGDNRTQSSDARACFEESIVSGGCNQPGSTPYITMSNIEGRAWVVLWPLEKIEIIPVPQYTL